jgi:hypothetical protein
MKFLRSVKTSRLLAPSLAYLALGIGLPLLGFVLVQQTLRLSAYDPQIQLAEDIALSTASGTTPDVAVGPPVEASFSLAPFVTVYDSNRQPVASSGKFAGKILAPPTGSFDAARSKAQVRFTWVPSAGGRYASVLVYRGDTHPGYVLVARNMYEVESRIMRLLGITFTAIAGFIIVGSLLLMYEITRKV